MEMHCLNVENVCDQPEQCSNKGALAKKHNGTMPVNWGHCSSSSSSSREQGPTELNSFSDRAHSFSYNSRKAIPLVTGKFYVVTYISVVMVTVNPLCTPLTSGPSLKRWGVFYARKYISENYWKWQEE